MVMESPRVLVVGINPWVDNTGINTLINFFDGWDKTRLAHLYTRAGLPSTHMCDRFFRISETKVMRSVLRRKTKTGETVENGTASSADTQEEQQIYRKKHGILMTLARELVWLFGKWKTKELRRFLDDFDADVLFFPVYSTVYMNRLQNYIRKYTKKPVVLYASDDNYSYKSVSRHPLSLLLRFWLRRQEKKLLHTASKIMVISPRQKEEYDRQFHTDCVVMTKGIDFSRYPFEEKPLGSPIRLVYTGKLIIGRWRSLAAIAAALEKINANGERMRLDIYTTDTLTAEQEAALNRGSSGVRGALTLDGVAEVQREADVLVFVESLERKFKNTARLSFSTKITDYLRSGKCIFAVGGEDIAPIDYFNRYGAAITASSYEEIAEKLFSLADDSSLIASYARAAYDCGVAHHSAEEMHRLLVDTIAQAASIGKE